MPNHKLYFVANLIHFFGILKYIKKQQLISISICCKKSLFLHFLQKVQFVNFEFRQNFTKNPRIFVKTLGLKLLLFSY